MGAQRAKLNIESLNLEIVEAEACRLIMPMHNADHIATIIQFSCARRNMIRTRRVVQVVEIKDLAPKSRPGLKSFMKTTKTMRLRLQPLAYDIITTSPPALNMLRRTTWEAGGSGGGPGARAWAA